MFVVNKLLWISSSFFSSVLLLLQINPTDSVSNVEFYIQRLLYAEAIQSGVS